MKTHTTIPQLIALTLTVSNSSGCFLFGCGNRNDTEDPVSVSDWVVDMARYDGMRNASNGNSGETGTDTGGGGTGGAYGYNNTPWDERDDASRCRFACAYASNNLSPYSGWLSPYTTMKVHTCELSIPTAEGDGTLSCTASVYHNDICIGGRRPLSWTADPRAITTVAQQLEGMAEMERVSVTAFLELAAQLELRGAPASLVARCRVAAQDEQRHVAVLVGLGVDPPRDAPEPAPATTSLLEIALHNATEGCVTETWAALLGRHQSEHARDAATRRAFAVIADDEGAHAQLAWDLHDWLCTQLSAEQVAQVVAARSQALALLESMALQQAMALPTTVREALGLPEPRTAVGLAREFGRHLSAAA